MHRAPAWRSADESVDLLSEARSALLLEGRGEAERLTARAQRAYRGSLAREIRRAAPDADREARAALAQARRAAAAGNGPALAAARTRLRSALLRGSYAVTTAAVRSGDVATAREWLLIREFRRATRFTRPGVDATVALDRLDARRTSPRRALLAVRKDLLDAYQARLSEQLEAGSKASRRGFAASQAQSGEFARGLWLILRPEYLRQRGEAATARADRTLDAYARAARDGNGRELGRARADVTRGARRFYSSPLHPSRAGQARLAVPALPRPAADRVRRRPRRRRLTIPFEVQEAVAFRDAAESALSDLEPVLDKRNPRALAADGAGPRRVQATVRRRRHQQEDRPAGSGRVGPRARPQGGRDLVPQGVAGEHQRVGLRPGRPQPRPDGGRRRRRRVEAGRAGPPRGLRVLRVRPRAEPALAGAEHREPGRGSGLVRRRCVGAAGAGAAGGGTGPPAGAPGTGL